MIVCVCNRLNEIKVREAVGRGATSPDQVYACHGARKVCGSCQETIKALIKDEAERTPQAA